MEVPRLGVESELPLPVDATATDMPDSKLHHSLWQHQILNPLSEAQAQTHILTDAVLVFFFLPAEPQREICHLIFKFLG